MVADKTQVTRRSTKGSALTHAEADANFTQLINVITDTTQNANDIANKADANTTNNALANKEDKLPAGGDSATFLNGTRSWSNLASTVRAITLAGVVFTTSSAISVSDTVLSAFGKLQAQINNKLGATDTAAAATKLATARNINGVPFDGSADITIAAGGGSGSSSLTFSTVAVAGQPDIVADSASDTLTIVAGSNITITSDASTDTLTISSTATGGGGALANYVEALSTASPNATVPVAQLMASNAATNVSIALTPKGTAGIAAQIADGVTSGGSKRGIKTIDFQMQRDQAICVASGNYSVIVGGSNNKASGQNSSVLGGNACSATGLSSTVVGGGNSTASGNYSVAGGNYCVAAGIYSVSFGNTSNAGADGSVAIGTSCYAQGDGSYSLGYQSTLYGRFQSVTGGYNTLARYLYGVESRANGSYAAQGDAQRSRVLLRSLTTAATATILTADANAASVTTSATNVYALPDNSTFGFEGTVTARDSAGNSSKWRVDGLAVRGSGVATIALVGTPSFTLVTQHSAASTWAVSVSVNTTLGALVFAVTGAASTSIKWLADIQTVEITG